LAAQKLAEEEQRRLRLKQVRLPSLRFIFLILFFLPSPPYSLSYSGWYISDYYLIGGGGAEEVGGAEEERGATARGTASR